MPIILYSGSTQNHDKLAEIKTYYVLYSPSRKMYISNTGVGFGPYKDANKYLSYDDALWDKDFYNEENNYDVKIVGPCMEGEEP